jgi:hypothetical protein
MKTVLDLTNLTVPGTWIFGTNTFGLISAVIRGAEEAERKKSLIAGIKATGDVKIPSHTVLVQEATAGGNIVCSEMTWPYDVGTSNRGHNNFILTEKYGIDALGSHLCGVFRCPALSDNDELQALATNWMKDKHKIGLDYGIENLLADLGIGKVNSNKEVCVQYGIAFHIWLQSRTNSFTLPGSWIIGGNKPNVISLEEAAEWCRANHWEVSYTKQVADDFDPHGEITAPVGSDF